MNNELVSHAYNTRYLGSYVAYQYIPFAMGVLLTRDVIATIAGGILSGKKTFPREGASGKACWNGKKKGGFE